MLQNEQQGGRKREGKRKKQQTNKEPIIDRKITNRMKGMKTTHIKEIMKNRIKRTKTEIMKK